MSTHYLGKVAELPAMYAQEYEMAVAYNISGRALKQLETAEQKMLKELARLEKEAARIWNKYAM